MTPLHRFLCASVKIQNFLFIGGMDTPLIRKFACGYAQGAKAVNRDMKVFVMPGTIHGIIGDNSAGKSTLMSSLYGFYQADAGGNWHGVPTFQACRKF